MTSTVPVWQAELSKASTRGKNIMMMVCITPPHPLSSIGFISTSATGFTNTNIGKFNNVCVHSKYQIHQSL